MGNGGSRRQGDVARHRAFLDQVYRFWFLPPSSSTKKKRSEEDWFRGAGEARDRFDAEIRDRFSEQWRELVEAIGEDHDLAREIAFASSTDQVSHLVALVIALDQFPRHLFRSEGEAAYAYDRVALEVALKGILFWTNYREKLETLLNEGGTHLLFLLLPFQHTTTLECQEWGLETIDRFIELSRELGFDKRHPGCREMFEQLRIHQVGHMKTLMEYGGFPKRILDHSKMSTKERDYVKNENGLPY